MTVFAWDMMGVGRVVPETVFTLIHSCLYSQWALGMPLLQMAQLPLELFQTDQPLYP